MLPDSAKPPQSVTQDNLNDVYDIIILGGGLAGLSLAVEICKWNILSSSFNLLIVEPRKSYVRDKTWSYWRQEPNAYSFLETNTWQQWRTSYLAESVIHQSKSCEQYQYCTIPSDAFYDEALAIIGKNPYIKLLLGKTAALQNKADAGLNADEINVVLNDGQSVKAKHFVFDSRPKAIKEPYLKQHFMGVEVLANQAIFDQRTVELMAFEPSANGVHFFYLLPYSSTKALIETTWISDADNNEIAHKPYTLEIEAYLKNNYLDTLFSWHFVEKGSLPLVNIKNNQSFENIIPIGSNAGIARAATGYAFLQTIADSTRLAKDLQRYVNAYSNGEKETIAAHKQKAIYRYMDMIFLALIQHKTSHKTTVDGAEIFMQLFLRCSPSSLVRFLSSKATVWDFICVIKATPFKQMIGVLVSRLCLLVVNIKKYK